MPNVKVFNMAGQEVGTMVLADSVFGAEILESRADVYRFKLC